MVSFLPGELECVQEAFADALDKTAVVKRNPNIGQPVKGSVPDQWDVVDAAAKCSMTLVSGGMVAGYLQQYANLLASQQGWIVRFKLTQDVQPRDRVVIDGQTYHVHAYLGPRSLELFRCVLATKVS